MVRNLLTALGCVAALALAQAAQADVGTVTPQVLKADPIYLGDVGTPGGVVYDNTNDGPPTYYFAPNAAAVPVELADDVPYTGTIHVNSFMFGYATTNTAAHECVITFYGAIAGDDGPDTTSAVASFDFTGLMGSTTGTPQGYIYTVDLAGQGYDFDWPNSTDSTGINENWMSFIYMQSGAGPILATGGGSQDLFWSGTDLVSPYEAGSFFWYFGGPPNPEGSFYIQLSGTIQ